MMDLMSLAYENIPVRGLSEIGSELKCFSDDNKVEVLEHKVSPWLSREKIEYHQIVCKLTKADLGETEGIAYISYDYCKARGILGSITVHSIPSYAFNAIKKVLNNCH